MVTALKTQHPNQKDIFEVHPHIEYVHDEGASLWEEAVTRGNEALTRMDKQKWRLGDIALKVVEFYGERAPRGTQLIEHFAKAINADPNRVREYATVAKFWDEDNRREMAQLRLITYTHMRDAMRLGDVETAKRFLYEVADNEWTVGKAREVLAERVGGKTPRKKVGKFQATLIQKVGTMHLFQLHQDPDEAPVQLSIGETYEISVYQSEE